MFSHVMLGATDMDASRSFYDATLGALGAKPGMTDPGGRAIWSHNGSMFMLTTPINGEPACHANGGTLGFAAGSTEQVDAWHRAGLANGGTSIEEAPGVRAGDYGSFYLAYLRDPTGNKLCAMHRMG